MMQDYALSIIRRVLPPQHSSFDLIALEIGVETCSQ